MWYRTCANRWKYPSCWSPTIWKNASRCPNRILIYDAGLPLCITEPPPSCAAIPHGGRSPADGRLQYFRGRSGVARPGPADQPRAPAWPVATMRKSTAPICAAASKAIRSRSARGRRNWHVAAGPGKNRIRVELVRTTERAQSIEADFGNGLLVNVPREQWSELTDAGSKAGWWVEVPAARLRQPRSPVANAAATQSPDNCRGPA